MALGWIKGVCVCVCMYILYIDMYVCVRVCEYRINLIYKEYIYLFRTDTEFEQGTWPNFQITYN